MKTFKKLPLVKENTIPLYACWIIHTSEKLQDTEKQQAFDGDPKEIQQINFTGNLEHFKNARMFFILEEVKETILDFSQGTMKVL